MTIGEWISSIAGGLSILLAAWYLIVDRFNVLTKVRDAEKDIKDMEILFAKLDSRIDDRIQLSNYISNIENKIGDINTILAKAGLLNGGKKNG